MGGARRPPAPGWSHLRPLLRRHPRRFLGPPPPLPPSPGRRAGRPCPLPPAAFAARGRAAFCVGALLSRLGAARSSAGRGARLLRVGDRGVVAAAEQPAIGQSPKTCAETSRTKTAMAMAISVAPDIAPTK